MFVHEYRIFLADNSLDSKNNRQNYHTSVIIIENETRENENKTNNKSDCSLSLSSFAHLSAPTIVCPIRLGFIACRENVTKIY